MSRKQAGSRSTKPAFLASGGEMGRRMREFNWAKHQLGNPNRWPQALKTAVRLMLTTNHPVFIFWGSRQFCFYNDAYSASLGPEKHPAMLGAPGRAMWREIWPIIGPQIRHVMAGKGATWHENHLVPIIRNGKLDEVYWTYSYSPIDSKGGVGGVLVICSETTKQVLEERQQNAVIARLRDVLKQAPSFVAILRGPEHRFEFVNDAYQRLIGPRDVVGKTVRDGLPEVAGQGFLELLDKVFRTGERYVGRAQKVVLQRQPGAEAEEHFLDFIYEPMRDAAGAVNGIFAEGYDVTDRTRADAALRELNETLERRVAAALAERRVLADIVENTDAFVQVADLDYRWLAINRASANEFERIFGVRPRVGDSMLDVLADQPQHQAAVKAMWSRALAGEEFTEIGEFGDPGRARRFYEMKYNTLRGPDGSRIGAYQFVYDVTDRLHEQQRLREAEAALQQAQKLEAIGQLTGGVAHDFNNLLTVISGGLNMLGRSADDEKRQMLLSRMTEAVTRGATLTRQLLAFSRRHELKPERIELASYLADMDDLLSRSLGGNIRVELDVPEDIWPVKADPNALQLAILNLAVNARDAMPNGGRVVIAARNDADEDELGPSVSLSVSDTGSGMAPEVLKKIFEPFFTTKEIGRGSGLGLAQVHGFAKQSGGKVEVKSAPGRGTTVTLILPRSEGDANQTASRPSAFRARPSKRDRGNALLVEDDHEVAAMTAEMLEHIGWHVTRVASAEAALGALSDGREINLVFSDVMMPGGQNGIELARAIRARRPGLPIVLTSGYSEKVRAEAAQSGLPLLPKPFSIDSLAAIVEVAQLGTRS